MHTVEPYREYDAFAWFYNKYWGRDYPGKALPILEELVLSKLPQGSSILDLCCGAGHVTRLLLERGYTTIGIDGSEAMLRYAWENVPSGEFILADAREFSFPPAFHAVLSTFESMNHILTREDLVRVFRNSYGALVYGGYFVFDLLSEKGYRAHWNKSSAIIADDHACFLRGGYHEEERLGYSEITMFRLENGWQRSDVTLFQRCYDSSEILSFLNAAGFRDAVTYDAERDFAMKGDLGTGRIFIAARK